MVKRYIPNHNEKTLKQLKEEIGIRAIDDLFNDLPKRTYPNESVLPSSSLTEREVRRELEKTLAKNRNIKEFSSFLGAGIWPHYVPAVVDAVAMRGEFLTSYTPYQPEISQGILQTLFEYQSMICELLNMDVSNSSMYDWASSLGEAARMASRITKRNEIIVPHYMDPKKKMVIKAYTEPAGIRIVEFGQEKSTGQIVLEDLKDKISNNTAAVYVENPSYLGFVLDSCEAVSQMTHDAKGLFMMGVDPISLGVLKPPGDFDADIAIGEGQPLGNYLNNGGPLLGIFTCRENLVREMPGRIVGMTTTQNGEEKAFCLVMQTREQHVRRQKATSNICSNEALCAVRCAVYMALLGPSGFKEIDERILSITNYAITEISKIESIHAPIFSSPHFKEFTVSFDQTSKSAHEINKKLFESGIIGGKPLTHEFPELGETALYCVTELHTFEEIEKLKELLENIMRC
jgi:glycine dehydrogenase subunit 1